MLAPTTILDAADTGAALADTATLERALELLRAHGHCLLRGFAPDMADFDVLTEALCSSVTFDPARAYAADSVQKVDAGTAAIGLHVENGNTPRVPELIAFYCRRAAREGSATTLCDGTALLDDLPGELRARLDVPLTVTRTLPEQLWKAYLAAEHPLLTDASEVRPEHLEQMLAAMPGQRAQLLDDGSLLYTVAIQPIRTSALCGRPAFANAILGPSFSYEAPVYRFADGSGIDEDTRREIAAIAERHTHEIPWRDGDIALVDNHRTLHGRRRIADAARRELYVSMGDLRCTR